MQALRKGIRLPPADPGPAGPLPPQEKVSLPLLWGETPLVQVGEPVLLGQKIADGGGDIVPLHASVSGIVAAIAPRTCHDGKRHSCIVLENDGREEWAPTVRPRALLEDLSDEQLLDLLYEAGIRLPDGAPLAAVLADAVSPQEILLITAIDPDPFLYTEDAAARRGEPILAGIRLLQRLLKPKRTVVAVAAGQKEALRAVGRWAGDLEICCAADRYPVAAPRLLAGMVTTLPPEQTLRQAGITLLGASACAAVSEAVYQGKPMISQTISVDWGTERLLFEAPLGVPLGAVLRACGQDAGAVILGGLMTGVWLENLTVPLCKGMSGLCLPPREQSLPAPTACIRCGRCARVCPVGLRPYLAEARGGAQNLPGCLHCGACQYICPAARPLLGAAGRRGREVASVGG